VVMGVLGFGGEVGWSLSVVVKVVVCW
jgi:hypothetical protein